MRRPSFTTLACPQTPVLVVRAGCTPWEAPTVLEAYPKRNELRVVGNHEINDVWEDGLALKVHAVLRAKGADWSSTDVVRIGYAEEPSRDVILWIGVRPISYEVGTDAALQCKGLLLDYSIKEVDVEIRESKVICAAGPQLLQPTLDSGSVVDVREPFTTLGITIYAQSALWAEGTGGFFLGGGSGGGG